MTSRNGDNYRRAAGIYDLLSTVYSGGQIHACKTAFLPRIGPGERVLFAGVGRGRDALVAARQGARVTAVDLSQAMLERLRRGLERRPGLHVDLVHGDILRVAEENPYDWVVANFFLNLFREPEAKAMLRKLVRLAAGDGRIVLGDFAPAQGRWPARIVQTLNWRLPNTVFSLLAKDAPHAFYDYLSFASEVGIEPQEIAHFTPIPWGPPCYRAILAKKRPPGGFEVRIRRDGAPPKV
jgi:ubiquinone/menaquinone biosynthesis C-methylase UbiE